MAKNFAQSKGARAERAAIELLTPVVNEVYVSFGMEQPKLQRNTMQADGGGSDIAGLEWLALEIKSQETLNINAWVKQTISQAKSHQIPILMYKQNHKGWKVQMHVTMITGGSSNVKAWAEISLETFLLWFKLKLQAKLEASK